MSERQATELQEKLFSGAIVFGKQPQEENLITYKKWIAPEKTS